MRHIREGGYTVEVLLLETLPGYFVGCTVYRPVDNTVRRPAVLIPHGHWKHGRVEHLESYSVPALAINLALQGYVSLTWDMVGYNDTRQTEHSFDGRWREQLWAFNPLGLQLWNSICATDYLSSRADVDRNRIACTGASGGATQTILLTAVDSRIACSAPVNMISAHYQGADPCEEAPGLRAGTNNVEVASMMAPRPMLMVSCTGDWTKNTPVEEYPAVQRVYALYDRQSRVANSHFNADHNYNKQTREAVYAFFARHLLGRPDARPTDFDIGAIEPQKLLVYAGGTSIPDGALGYDNIFERWMGMARRSASTERSRRVLRTQLRYALGASWPSAVNGTAYGDYLLLSRPGTGDLVHALWFDGRGTPAVVVHPDGKSAAKNSTEVADLRRAGRPVLLIDAFQTGDSRPARERGGRWYLSYNQTDDAHRVQDILTALRYSAIRTGRAPALVGVDKAAIWSTFAAAVAPLTIDFTADTKGFEGTDEDMRRDFFVPCIQRAGGFDAALRILGRRK